MTHYILVHGAWEGSWSWEYTAPALIENGHTVTSVDLAGSYGNKQEISEVSLDGYVQTVVETINKLDEKVILVGHSLAGAVISQVAELIPQKIERLVYVTAFLLQSGDSILEAMQRDPGGEFLPELIFSEDGTYASATEHTLRRKAFHDVSEERILGALPLMAERQATEPFIAKAVLSEERFNSVPKTYIRTTIDKMVSTSLQDEMIAGWNVDRVYDLQSGHFPTLSKPEELADLLLRDGASQIRSFWRDIVLERLAS